MKPWPLIRSFLPGTCHRFGGGPSRAKKHLRIYEVPISHYRRTCAEGRKMNWRNGCRAIWCILKYSIFR